MRFLIWSLCFIFFPLQVFGADEYSLSQLVKLAVDRNPELRAVELESNSLAARADFGALWDDPVVEFSFEQSHQPVNPPTGDTHFGRIAISESIPRPGRLKARQGVFASLYRVGELEMQLSKVDLTIRVLKSAFDFKIASERWEHSRERVARIKTVDTFIRSRPFAAPQRQAEAVITRSKLAILEKQFRQFAADRVAAWNELKVLTGLDAEPRLKVDWFDKATRVVSSEFLAKAEIANPEIRLRSLKLEAQKAQASLERADSWQGLTLTGSYANGSGANPERNFGLGISFPIPVVNANRAAIRNAEILVTAEQARLEWAKSRLKASVEIAAERFVSAAKSIELLPVEKLSASERDMKKIDEGFKRGQVELITYLEADAQHFENLNEALESQREYLLALSDLSYLTGEAPQISEL